MAVLVLVNTICSQAQCNLNTNLFALEAVIMLMCLAHKAPHLIDVSLSDLSVVLKHVKIMSL